jgi:uncharacterized membrane protein YcaP (DUF421 family)
MDILIPDISITEKVARTAVVYLFLLAAFRITGKRQLGQMTAFDLVVLLIISNVVQNAMIGADNSLGGGLLGVLVILVLNGVIAWITSRSRRAERLVENSPTVLVSHGRILWPNMRRELMSLAELRAALRREGMGSLREVRWAVLEEDGHLSVIPRRRDHS